MSETPDLRHAQLFLDDALIERTVRLQRVVHQPHKYHGNPVYSVEAPWEGNGVVYLGGVYVDPTDGLWKAWYVTLYPPAYPEITYAVCLITSRDGVHWERPELDVYRGHNGERTNIVLDLGKVGGTGAPSILFEPEHADEPWTMVLSSCEPGSGTYQGYVLRSPDGVRWSWLRPRPHGVVHRMHDRCTAFRGPDPAFPYVLLSRGWEDTERWGFPRVAHRVALSEDGSVAQSAPELVICPDLEDDPAGQIYHAHAFPYEGMYIGLFQWFWETEDPYGEMELMVSRDSVRWSRVRPRVPFLPRSPHGGAGGAFDCQVTDTALSPPIRTRSGAMETLWFYYWGGAAMHGNRHLTHGRAMGLAQLRADGFCSVRARRFPGCLFTKPFVWPGGELQLNVSTLGGSGAGSLRTEVLTPNLEPIDGLRRDDADPMRGDGIRLVQTWRGDPRALDGVRGKPIRFRFHLENTDLFAYRAAETKAD